MSLLEKLFKYLFPKQFSLLDYQKDYINVLEERYEDHVSKIKELNQKIREISKSSQVVNNSTTSNLPDIQKQPFCPNSYQAYLMKIPHHELMEYLSGWIECNKQLPNSSLSEVIVSDGDIVSTVQYDYPTQTFLKTFGSQTMRVPKPKFWRLMPIAPYSSSTEAYISPRSKSLITDFQITYTR